MSVAIPVSGCMLKRYNLQITINEFSYVIATQNLILISHTTEGISTLINMAVLTLYLKNQTVCFLTWKTYFSKFH